MRTWIMVALAAVVLAAGCELPIKKGAETGSPVEGLQVAPELRYSDVPVPRGFVYIAKDSWTYEGKEGHRLADLRYKGDSSVQSAVDFFLEQMPISGWEKEMVVGQEDKKRLRFRHGKKSESCEVIVERTTGPTYIVIRIN